MKNYSEYSTHSVSMVGIDKLTEVLQAENKKNKFEYIIESGTYIGLGSTKMLAETFINEPYIPQIITLEASWYNWKKAKQNLKKYNFVTPVWGFSVSQKIALNFVKNDYALNNPEEYPDIFIDGADNPINFYINELTGKFGKSRFLLLRIIHSIFRSNDRKKYYQGENLLEKYLNKFQDKTPLIVLDSSGGIGLLEFNTVRQIMDKNPYYLLLDDIHHIKHFRSYEEIKKSTEFEILMADEKSGWVLAKKR